MVYFLFGNSCKVSKIAEVCYKSFYGVFLKWEYSRQKSTITPSECVITQFAMISLVSMNSAIDLNNSGVVFSSLRSLHYIIIY